MRAQNGWAYGVVALGQVSSNQTLDCGAGNIFTMTLAANITVDFSNVKAGQSYTVIFTQDGTGNREITWSANVDIQGNFTFQPDSAAGTVSTYGFMGTSDTSTQVSLESFSPFVTTGSRIVSANNTNISVQPGLNTTGHSGGAAGGMRMGMYWGGGKLGNVGGSNGKGSFQVWQHPEAGTLEDKQVFGTSGTPDTDLYIRYAWPAVRFQVTGSGAGNYFLSESVAGANFYHDFGSATVGAWRWRSNLGAVIFEVAAAGGVSFGVSAVANQGKAIGVDGMAAPAGTPAANDALLWYDTTAKTFAFKNSITSYSLRRDRGQGDLGDVTGATVLDAADSNFQKLTAIGNVSITFVGGTAGDEFTLVFIQDGTGNRTLTLGAGITQATGVVITPSVAAGDTSIYTFKFLTATTAYLTGAQRA